MVLGLSKSKYHVPLQSVNTILAFIGMYFGHHHGGRQFPETVHGFMAKILTWTMITQAALGIFLKLHVMERNVRPWVVPFHSLIGKTFPVLGWTQIMFGVATALDFCRGGNLGQCAAHYIMGSAFIGYAAILVIMLNLGGKWLERKKCSQEMLDSSVITAWGIGVLWWAGGMLGIFLSRKGKRSFVPAVIILMTGWGMSAHEQALMISSKIHGLFGYALMGAGALRVVEICFVLNDQPTPSSGHVRIFQHLPPYLLVLGGTLFMSATDEEMHNADNLGIDHVTYALFDFSLSFLIYLIITFLVHLYSNSGRNALESQGGDGVERGREIFDSEEEGHGYAKVSTDDRRSGERRRGEAEDGPEAFELEERESSNESEAVKIGGEDEVDWIGRRGPGVSL
ncbi:hypothetical protein B9479_002613 [Cryptococcus floricola]|uniref:Cytochrome b561 domain-containing protein n=1 Tax=Cryptococcus floricola TaxID=2591691 RepID=A0A5D3B3F9_9TREE|nr:hypothetical protein B9479_002613 [Cryptococcus floricola]